MIFRVFSVLAAFFLVLTIAIGTLLPPDQTLAASLDLLDRGLAARVHDGAVRIAPGLWNWAVAPLMVRPDWLVPAALGLLCAGGVVMATTLGVRPRTGPTRRRRS